MKKYYESPSAEIERFALESGIVTFSQGGDNESGEGDEF